MANTYFKNFLPVFDLGFHKGVSIMVYCWILITKVGDLDKEKLEAITDMVFSHLCWSEFETQVVVMVVGRRWAEASERLITEA